MVMKVVVFQGGRRGGFFGGKVSCPFSPSKYSLNICHQNFTTFFTMQLTISEEICHLVLTLEVISRKKSPREVMLMLASKDS